ncbi:MAG: hypothetical protein ABLT11_11590, partial [Candidatus Acidiferrum sp.]
MNPITPFKVAPATTLLPLCVDLDGTVVRSDTLLEDVFSLPLNFRLLWCFAGLFSSRAVFKKRVAQNSALNASLLPYNKKLLAYLREQKSAGRSLILVTAADSITAQKVADHLELFDEV